MKKEIISQFKEMPKTRIAWWVMGLGLGSILVMFVAATPAMVLVVAAIVVGILAFRKGERSWVLWLGLVPAILAGAFWVFMIIGESIFLH